MSGAQTYHRSYGFTLSVSGSYLVMNRGISAETAAKWISLFYLGITFGRFLNGFLAMKLSDKTMIRIGQGIIAIGILSLFLPFKDIGLCISFILIGLGCAPIYPCIIHSTPENFGKNLSQVIIGVQMASAYMGSTFMPPLFGLIAEHITVKLFPFYLIALVIIMFITVELLNKVKKASN